MFPFALLFGGRGVLFGCCSRNGIYRELVTQIGEVQGMFS